MHILMYSISTSRPSGPPVLAFWCLLFVWTDSASGLFAPVAQEDPCALHVAAQRSHQPSCPHVADKGLDSGGFVGTWASVEAWTGAWAEVCLGLSLGLGLWLEEPGMFGNVGMSRFLELGVHNAGKATSLRLLPFGNSSLSVIRSQD